MADEQTVPLATGENCRWCGFTHPADHGKICPNVKALDFAFGDERVTRVEFLTTADFQRRVPGSAAGNEPEYPRLPSEKT